MSNKEYYLDEVVCDKMSKDPDHTKKAREFYADFWGKTLSDDVLDYDGSVGRYRGDTIISFNTVSGCMIRLLPIYTVNYSMPGAQKKRLEDILSQDVSQCTKDNFQKFYDIYHSRANFMPLIYEEWEKKPNLNKVKGTNARYNDFPDLFFKDIKSYYMGDPKVCELEIFKNKMNAEYFADFSDWKAFVEGNYLQDFFTDNSYSEYVQLAPRDITMPYTGAISAAMSDEDKAVCVKYIELFLTNAIGIIEKRAERLAKVKEQ